MAAESEGVKLAATLRATMADLIAARVPRSAIAAIKQDVRRWQNGRFERTYRDLASNPRYRAAIDFFLRELYGEADMTARDADMEKILPLMARVLPAAALHTVRDSLSFEALSERLDTDLAAHLGDRALDDQSYGEAFRACGRRAERERQIGCVSEIGHALDRMTRWPLIGTTLKLMRVPAGAAGLATLQAFLEGGYRAFREMHGADEFLATIVKRETAIVERLFAAHPRPFDLEDTA